MRLSWVYLLLIYIPSASIISIFDKDPWKWFYISILSAKLDISMYMLDCSSNILNNRVLALPSFYVHVLIKQQRCLLDRYMSKSITAHVITHCVKGFRQRPFFLWNPITYKAFKNLFINYHYMGKNGLYKNIAFRHNIHVTWSYFNIALLGYWVNN